MKLIVLLETLIISLAIITLYSIYNTDVYKIEYEIIRNEQVHVSINKYPDNS